MAGSMKIFRLVVTLIFFILHMKRGINADEVDILMAVKGALVDPKNYLKSWDPTLVYPCGWFHVTCNENSEVIRIDLGDASLSGYLSPEITKLSKLQYLSLFRNSITGSIPNEIGNLANLVSLDLSYNNFNGPIPNTIGNLFQLKFLRLNNNDLSGCIPTSSWKNMTSSWKNIHPVVLDISSNPLLCSPETHPPCYC